MFLKRTTSSLFFYVLFFLIILKGETRKIISGKWGARFLKSVEGFNVHSLVSIPEHPQRLSRMFLSFAAWVQTFYDEPQHKYTELLSTESVGGFPVVIWDTQGHCPIPNAKTSLEPSSPA